MANRRKSRVMEPVQANPQPCQPPVNNELISRLDALIAVCERICDRLPERFDSQLI